VVETVEAVFGTCMWERLGIARSLGTSKEMVGISYLGCI